MSYVDEAHSRDLRVVPYTINQADAVRDAAAAGVDALITDDPLMALRTLDTEPAAVELTPLAKKLARVRRKRRLPVRVSTDERATVELVARLGGRRVGRRTVEFDSAGKRRVVLRVSRRGAKAMKGEDRVKVRLVAKTLDVAGNAGKTRATARLR
jgi:hypothetical protein